MIGEVVICNNLSETMEVSLLSITWWCCAPLWQWQLRQRAWLACNWNFIDGCIWAAARQKKECVRSTVDGRLLDVPLNRCTFHSQKWSPDQNSNKASHLGLHSVTTLAGVGSPLFAAPPPTWEFKTMMIFLLTTFIVILFICAVARWARYRFIMDSKRSRLDAKKDCEKIYFHLGCVGR